MITKKQVNQNLLEEKEKHQISDSGPKKISQCLPKYPLQQGPERVFMRETDSIHLFIGGGVLKKLSL